MERLTDREMVCMLYAQDKVTEIFGGVGIPYSGAVKDQLKANVYSMNQEAMVIVGARMFTEGPRATVGENVSHNLDLFFRKDPDERMRLLLTGQKKSLKGYLREDHLFSGRTNLLESDVDFQRCWLSSMGEQLGTLMSERRSLKRKLNNGG